ncbi:short-chain dehydrogenase [Siphonobacter sp. SORGH_AS_0500]|uniref:SDR family NAD(P)-dependent oxidoreductase n=1 Tax=Siphonobacter sp. SORGH_AS_0500 TaxID=1864824 RepID=UPI000CC70B79|nr:SDR family oxidoreductase [Siphonobacter sp. SORGH_AS_0500]PKK37442.1 short-chain dehydrogenase [Siphonobacter sp. SORGH_AS_0500]
MHKSNVVIITGAAGGIGRATAHAFAAEGYRLTLSDLDENALIGLAAELSSQYATRCFPLAGDLADSTYLQAIVSETVAKWGSINVLVNNAAWRTLESLRTMKLDDWERTLKVCLTAPAFLTKWAAEVMEANGNPGVIINITSMMASRPSGMGSGYIAAKGGLESLIRETAATYGRSGIRVVGVAPGYVETPLSRDYQGEDGENISQQLIDELVDFVPLGRGGDPAEIAEAIRWLASGSASYITGTTLLVDGGFSPNFNKYSIKKRQLPNEF